MTTAHIKGHAPPAKIAIATIGPDAPWRWLDLAWKQMWQAPKITLFYGIIFASISAGLFSLLINKGMLPLFLPLIGGFLLLGPLFAVGLYETARRLSNNEPVALRDVCRVKPGALSQIGFIGVVLMLAFLVWIQIAMLLFAVFVGLHASIPPADIFFAELFTTANGLALLISGTFAGGMIAFTIFTLSALSVPLALDREIDAVTAMITSYDAVKKNSGPLLLWGWLIALLIVFGIATAFVGLVITFPLVGLATWHGYKELTATL